jgi:SAM-dependent methyltransferase
LPVKQVHNHHNGREMLVLSGTVMATGVLERERTAFEPTQAELRQVLTFKFGPVESAGWGVQLRARHGYYLPDDYYEALIMRLAQGASRWADIGCGRDLFPHNRALSRHLASRCERLVGVDCDDTLDENPFVHERVKCRIEDFHPDEPFDLVTLRMVAEHITDPAAAVKALARLTRPGGLAVVYTINRWSPVSLAAYLVQFRFHHAIKHRLWKTEEKDTFPVAYRMNTRAALARLFGEGGFRESHFAYLDDCRTFSQFPLLHRGELWAWRGLRAVGLRYPENCLLGVYVKEPVGEVAVAG